MQSNGVSVTEVGAGSAHRAPYEATPLLRWIPAASGALGAAAVAAIFGAVFYEIVSRYLFGLPTSWAVEYSTYALIALAFVGAAYAQAEGSNVRIDVVTARLRPDLRSRLAILGVWLSLAFVLLAIWQVILYGWGEWTFGGRSIVLGVPRWIPYVPIGTGLIALAVVMVGDLARIDPPRWPALPALAVLGLAAVMVAVCMLGRQPVVATPWRVDVGAAMLIGAVLALSLAWSGTRMFLTVAALGAVVAAVLVLAGTLSFGWAAALVCLVLLALLFLGLPVAFALGMTCALAMYLLLPISVAAEIAARAESSLSSFSFTAVPMYVLMGALLLKTGLASELFSAMLVWLGRVPGGLAHAGLGASTVFAAVSGSSIATAATIGTIACPEMTKRGYSPRLAYGAIAAGGTLGILIPPSIPLIVYGTAVGESVSALFFAGIVPGLMLAAGFMIVAFVWAWARPDAAPSTARADVDFGPVEALARIAPIGAIIVFVLATIYGGVVTPTEAGALGAFCALVLCAMRGRLSVAMIWSVLKETVRVCAFLLLIVWGASMLTYLFEYLQISERVIGTVENAGLSPLVVMAVICIVYIVLGMFIDPISMMLVTLPVTYPLVTGLGYDGVWFGIVLVILVEIGLVTPPVGLNLFILQGIGQGVSIRDIAIGVLPFIAAMIGMVVLLFVFPQIALIVPGMLR